MLSIASQLGLWLVVFTLFIQWTVASTVKAKQPGAVPGKIDDSLGPERFVFRAHRTLMNSQEIFPLFIGAVIVAYFTQANSLLLAICIWVFALSRIAYTGWYYMVATEKNPSFRSLIFAIGLLASLVLLFSSLFFIG